MEKTPRYTQRERNMVLGYAAQYKDVIENKRTDAESNRKKDEVWRQIAKEFNARVYHQRSSKQLRQLYKNMKLLLKKDLCGEGKGNRSFMDLLNTLSQQESVAQYISEQMSPSGYSSSRQQKYDDDYDDSKLPSVGYDGMDTDVIVIKSEDISDNEQSQNGGNPDDMDDDDDDCLSNKGIPEVCLEEEDDEIFATDLRQQQSQQSGATPRQSGTAQQQTQQTTQPEITIQNVGGIRVGSIGSLAHLKALQNGNNSALSITHANGNSGSGNGNGGNSNANGGGSSSNNNNYNSARNQLTAAEQAQQQLLLNGLGLSAVHAPDVAPPTTTHLPALQRAGNHSNGHSHNHSNNNNNNSGNLNPAACNSNTINQLLLSLSGSNFGHTKNNSPNLGSAHTHNHHHNGSKSSGHGSGGSNRNEYLMSLAIEERKLKLDLLSAQIEYWKTLTKKLETNAGHNPTPACLCHFPGKLNVLQTQTSSS